jgi:hypothetical protein
LQSVLLAPVVVSSAILRSNEVDTKGSDSFLLADSYAGGAELTINKASKVHFLRNIRSQLSNDEASINTLAGELKRTAISAMGSELPVEFEKVIALGINSTTTGSISTSINKPVQAVALESLIDLQRLNPNDLGNIQIVGWHAVALALAEPIVAKLERPIEAREIDYLHPRRPIAKKRSKPKMFAIAGCAATVLIGGLFWYFWTHSSLDAEIAQLQQQIAGDKPSLEIANTNVAHHRDIETFVNNSVNWLDELAYISTRSLPADKQVIVGINGSVVPLSGVANLSFNTGVVEQSLGPEVERSLRSPGHSVSTTGWTESADKNATYRYVATPVKIIIPPGTKTVWASETEATTPTSDSASPTSTSTDEVKSTETSTSDENASEVKS